MKKTVNTIKIYCSAFVSLPSDWDSLSLPKYGDLPFELDWQKNCDSAEIVIIPSHLTHKSLGLFKSFLKTVPKTATLVVYPEPLAQLVELVDVTTMQLEHSHWMFPSSVLVPEEIIHQFKNHKAGL